MRFASEAEFERLPAILNKSLGSVSLTNPQLSIKYLLLLVGFFVLAAIAMGLSKPISGAIGAQLGRLTGAQVNGVPPGFAAFMGAS